METVSPLAVKIGGRRGDWDKSGQRHARRGFARFFGLWREETMMAVAGGVTVAYVCRLDSKGGLDVHGTSALRSSCCGVDDALTRLLEGRPAMVAGADMAAVQRALAGVEEGTGVVV